jgi:hypothetical protein
MRLWPCAASARNSASVIISTSVLPDFGVAWGQGARRNTRGD